MTFLETDAELLKDDSVAFIASLCLFLLKCVSELQKLSRTYTNSSSYAEYDIGPLTPEYVPEIHATDRPCHFKLEFVLNYRSLIA